MAFSPSLSSLHSQTFSGKGKKKKKSVSEIINGNCTLQSRQEATQNSASQKRTDQRSNLRRRQGHHHGHNLHGGDYYQERRCRRRIHCQRYQLYTDKLAAVHLRPLLRSFFTGFLSSCVGKFEASTASDLSLSCV